MGYLKNRKDSNEKDIVEALEKAGATVATNHHDLFVGFRGFNFWLEIKSDAAVSKRTGQVLLSSLRPSQKELLRTWRGHYAVVSSPESALIEIGAIKK